MHRSFTSSWSQRSLNMTDSPEALKTLISPKVSPMSGLKPEVEEALTRRPGALVDLKESKVLSTEAPGNWDGNDRDGEEETERRCRSWRVCAETSTAISGTPRPSSIALLIANAFILFCLLFWWVVWRWIYLGRTWSKIVGPILHLGLTKVTWSHSWWPKFGHVGNRWIYDKFSFVIRKAEEKSESSRKKKKKSDKCYKN